MESEVADLEPPNPHEDAPQQQHLSYTAMSLFLSIVIMSSNEREISPLNAFITTHTQLTLLLFQERHYEDIQREYKVRKSFYLISESDLREVEVHSLTPIYMLSGPEKHFSVILIFSYS